jgi:hypothetical protein
MNNSTAEITTDVPGISMITTRGPFQNNGASPWYVDLPIGIPWGDEPAQVLKMSLDTGGVYHWVTSFLCQEDKCVHYGDSQYDFSLSASFEWVTRLDQTLEFGPWGSIVAWEARDVLWMDTDVKISSYLYMANKFNDTIGNFSQLNWDGFIGMPSEGLASPADGKKEQNLPEESVYEQSVFRQLLNQGVVSPTKPFLAFDTDAGPDGSTGTVTMGQLDPAYKDALDYLFIPWVDYGHGYSDLWTGKMASISLDDQELPSEADAMFLCLDTGASQFKGDVEMMSAALKIISEGNNPVLTIKLDQGADESMVKGVLKVPPEVYNVFIEAGPDKGEVIPQFLSMEGLPGLALVGSVLMDYLYTVHEFKVWGEAGQYKIAALGMWIFNKTDGRRIIQNIQDKPAAIYRSS